MTSKPSICLVAGARPNFMKVAPLLTRIREQSSRLDAFLVHTGQHYDAAMSDVFFRDLGLPEPDVFLGVGSGSHAVQTAQIMMGFERVLLDHQPDMVLVVGDVNSTIAAGLVAAKMGIPLCHVEAGLRSGDRRMPEEINRILTDQLSDLLFTTSLDAHDHLAREGVALDKVHFVGNLMIESLIRHQRRFDATALLSSEGLQAGGYALVTLHRPSNVDDPVSLKGLWAMLERLSRELPVLFPVHPRTRKMAQAFGLTHNGSLRLVDPVGYLEFMALQRDARLVLTDSGGIQEETTFFGVPCITVRENTERPVTITQGSNVLAGTDPEAVYAEAQKILAGKVKKGGIPDKWDDQVSRRIVDVLEHWF